MEMILIPKWILYAIMAEHFIGMLIIIKLFIQIQNRKD